MARCGDGKLLFCVLFLSCCIATLTQRPTDCCHGVSRTTIERRLVVDYRQQFRGQGCDIDAVILVTRRGRELCVATDLPGLSYVMTHVDNRKKGCKEGRYKHRRCFGVKRVNDPEHIAFHSPAMTTPPTLTTLAQRPVDCCNDVSRTIIERRSLADYRIQVKGQQGCAIDAVIFVDRHGKKLCVATDLPGLSDVMRYVDNLKKVCKENNYLFKHCFGVKTENYPEPTAFHSPAMTTPPTMMTLEQRPMDSCTDVSRKTIGSVILFTIQIDGKKYCLAMDLLRLSDVRTHYLFTHIALE